MFPTLNTAFRSRISPKKDKIISLLCGICYGISAVLELWSYFQIRNQTYELSENELANVTVDTFIGRVSFLMSFLQEIFFSQIWKKSHFYKWREKRDSCDF